jgi:hypothetical protein
MFRISVIRQTFENFSDSPPALNQQKLSTRLILVPGNRAGTNAIKLMTLWQVLFKRIFPILWAVRKVGKIIDL